MRIAVIGATGRTGRHIVEQALGQGDDVVAFARTPETLGFVHPRLQAVAGDVRDVSSLRRAVKGCDAVASAIGDKPASRVDTYSVGIANLMEAMAEHDVMRLAAISAAGTFARNDRNLSAGYRLMMRAVLRGLYDDLERMETRIMASGMQWTIVRPSGLTDGPQTGEYRVGLDGKPLSAGGRISRADVAGYTLKSLKVDTWVGRAVTLAY
ncbi:MAG: NAD(P)H-binding protein [Actinomycetota bacterium]|nr:NAD(P)H-binding protein [Actinomycetota bacterium]MDZ4180731.1 NAD(P)H-binding protein [Coriobacteriia bacterium]